MPVKNSISEFGLKQIDKKKLYNFLREMEFNRLLSSAISTYGETKFSADINKIKDETNNSKISKNNYHLISSNMKITIIKCLLWVEPHLRKLESVFELPFLLDIFVKNILFQLTSCLKYL